MGFNVRGSASNANVIIKIQNLKIDQLRGIRKAFYFIGKDLVKDANSLILQQPKHGKLYTVRRGGRRFRHRASAPGESPANLSGSLRSALDFNVVGGNRLEFGVQEKSQNRKGTPSGVIYGKFLELGTTKMDERPFLKPTIKKNYRNTQKHFETQLKQQLDKKI